MVEILHAGGRAPTAYSKMAEIFNAPMFLYTVLYNGDLPASINLQNMTPVDIRGKMQKH